MTSGALLALFTDHLWQAAAVGVALYAFLRLGDRLPARIRHDAAFAALAAACLLPLCSFLPPLSSLGIDAIGFSHAGYLAPGGKTGGAASVPALWLTGIWMAGVLIMLVRVAADLLAMRRIIISARPATLPSALAKDFSTLAVCTSNTVRGPVTAGLLRSTILLPAGLLEALSELDLRAILEHERAHVQRGDVRKALLQSLLLTIFWWSPPLRWIAARIEEERELACDEAAVARTGDARGFAMVLLRQAETLASSRAAAGAMMAAVGHPSLVARRIRALTAPRPARPPALLLPGGILCGALAATAFVSAWAAPRISLNWRASVPHTIATVSGMPAPFTVMETHSPGELAKRHDALHLREATLMPRAALSIEVGAPGPDSAVSPNAQQALEAQDAALQARDAALVARDVALAQRETALAERASALKLRAALSAAIFSI